MTAEHNPQTPERLAEAKALYARLQVRRAEYRRDHPVDETEVFCPFSSDGNCLGGCPTMRARACINGQGGD